MTSTASGHGMRALPIAAAILILLLALKLAGLGTEASQFLGLGHAMAAGPVAPEDAGHASEPHPPKAAPAPAAAGPSEPTASEADVLERLGERRQQLDARERDLDMREKLIGAAEKRIEERIAELKSIEARIEASFGKRDDDEEKKLSDLVRMYEAMKPVNAAEIFNTLELGVLLDVVSRMKPVKASPIVAAMKPERAQELTIELARRKVDPAIATAPPLAASPGG